MKTLRYLLIAMVVLLAHVCAQAQLKVANKVEYQFSSTSTWTSGSSASSLVSSRATSTLMGDGSISFLMRSGSTLPIAAANGMFLEEDLQESAPLAGPRRVRPDDWQDPMENPIGDGTWPLLMMAMAYCAYVAYRKVRAMRVVRATTSESALDAKKF